MKTILNKLSQEVINQIAAGEVIERPASVVKELVDNSIDAEATKIVVKVKNGGIDLIEVSDNGFGIPKENLSSVFDAHTTSKISSIDDLNTLMSMGFRGEALSTITSVSQVRLDSKFVDEDIANTVSFNEKGVSEVSPVAKEVGTTVRVENIFYNIPARKKYLKSASTEFRKIYEMLKKYYLIYPNIHFVLEKDGKVVDDIHAVKGSKSGEIKRERLKDVLGDEIVQNMFEVFSDGSGMKISGYISHPSTHGSKNKQQYVFLNNRPIVDKGIVRAIMEGYSRYLPSGEKVDFVINIHIKPELVDVNVHPRKEEVRFENPYRMYLAVEEAVKYSLQKNLSYTPSSNSIQTEAEVKNTSSTDFSSLRDRFNQKHQSIDKGGSNDSYKPKDLYINSRSGSVRDTLLFSSELLKDQKQEVVNEEVINIDDVVNVAQIFTKYIVVEFSNAICWIVDQHAAAERINYEKLMRRESTESNLQNLLVPSTIKLSKEEKLFLEENKKFFDNLGFIYDVEEKNIVLKTVPAEYAESDFKQIFFDIFELDDNLERLSKSFKERKNDILATISCHTSVRTGQKLNREEMLQLLKDLIYCENPYSCPHGRPVVWKLSLSEIDSHFERTY